MNIVMQTIKPELIKSDELYTIPQLCKILNMDKYSVIRRCKSWKIEYTNVWTEQREIRIVKGSNILKYLNWIQWKKK